MLSDMGFPAGVAGVVVAGAAAADAACRAARHDSGAPTTAVGGVGPNGNVISLLPFAFSLLHHRAGLSLPWGVTSHDEWAASMVYSILYECMVLPQ